MIRDWAAGAFYWLLGGPLLAIIAAVAIIAALYAVRGVVRWRREVRARRLVRAATDRQITARIGELVPTQQDGGGR